MLNKELQSLIAESRRKIERQRVKVRQPVKGRPRGRPIKHSGTYYTRSVLVSDRLMLKIHNNRLPGEPLGSTLERMVGMAEQKRMEAPLESFDSIVNYDNIWNHTWNEVK